MKGKGLLVVLAAVALLLAACNGSLGGYVKVTAKGASAAAYQVDDGDWRAADDPESFDFWAFNKYQVAVRCGNKVNVMALTPGDTGNLLFDCEETEISFSVKYDIRAATGADRAALYYLGGLGAGAGTTGTIAANHAQPGQQDLVLVASDSGGHKKAAMVKTVVAANGATYRMTMSSSDSGNLLSGGTVADFSASVPAGWASSGALTASLTPHGTEVLSDYLHSSGGSYTSYTFAVHDLVSAFAYEHGSAPQKTLQRLIVADGKAVRFEPDLPAAFNATMTHDYLPSFSGLSYSSCNDLVGFHLEARWGGLKLSALASNGYLGDGAEYELPDLTDLDGFTDVYPSSGDQVTTSAEAICSNKSIGEISSQPLNKTPLALRGLDLRIAGDQEKYTAP